MLNIGTKKEWSLRTGRINTYKKDDMRELSRLYRKIQNWHPHTYHEHKQYPHNRRGGISRIKYQQCVVKMRYGTTKTKNLEFIRNYLPQKNKPEVTEKPELFSDVPVTAEFLEQYKEHASDHFFKFIVSPGSNKVDFESLVKTLVKKMEAAQGRKFRWVAAVHRDTGHYHAHVLIDGTDMNGEPVGKLSYRFITQEVRAYAQEICTAQLGPRTELEIQTEKDNLYKRYRYTSLDKIIEQNERKIVPGSSISGSGKWGSYITVNTPAVERRFETLVKMGLAGKDRNISSTYYLENNWAGKLRYMGRYNSFLTARNDLTYTLPYHLELYNRTDAVQGRVTRIYKANDEDSWNNAYLVENRETGHAWYIPVFYEPKDYYLGCKVEFRNEADSHGLLRLKSRIIER